MTEFFDLRPGYAISRVIRGGWQLAGGHGAVDRQMALDDLIAFAEAGITTFDCADIYTGVEEIIGAFRTAYRNSHGPEALARIKVHTKFVPDLDILPVISKRHVQAVIDQSLGRLNMERLDLVQFHWWDYAIPGAGEAARWLTEMQQDGKIDLLGGTNFDTPHSAELIARGFPLASMQVQYSLLDARPENGLVALCRAHDVHLLCYGSVAGGFLSDRWLGKREPKPPFENRSLTKYKLIIDDFGGWDLFQELLATLRRIADAHRSDIATIASRAILDRPQVGAVIVGARNRSHVAANQAIFALRLTQADHAAIAHVLRQARGPEGDTFTLERDRNGRHGSIMKYNLNKEAS
ncbi:aldo/keto reductase [Taklimakanibacter lacteus]|uniref:aldo/keto reductase n=1 Tax=Taklimakanibacter lacteus TaxID=2268456 RepID=UPI000E65F284